MYNVPKESTVRPVGVAACCTVEMIPLVTLRTT